MGSATRFCCMARMCFWRRMAILCSESIRLYRSLPTPFWWRIWRTITGRRCRCWADEVSGMSRIDTASFESAVEMERHEEQGFMLVGLIVAIFFVLLALSVAAPKVAQELRREREVEAVHRGNQYVRAIRLYYRKFGHYPGSIEQLEKTNNMRFLRQRYVDPMTGKDDWRLIKVGEAKTTVKGFFGQPLAGLTPGLGSAASLASAGPAGAGAAGAGQPGFGASSSGGPGYSPPGTGGRGSSGGTTLGGSSPGA